MKPFHLSNRYLSKEQLCVLSTGLVGRRPHFCSWFCCWLLYNRVTLAQKSSNTIYSPPHEEKGTGLPDLPQLWEEKSWSLPATEAQSTRATLLWQEKGYLTLKDHQWQSSQPCFKNLLASCRLKSGSWNYFSLEEFSFISQLAYSIIVTFKV